MSRGLDPVANEESELLILGTFPGEKSLKIGRYYAQNSNRFWEVVFKAAGRRDPSNYGDRYKQLLGMRIALWDVIKQCQRIGSLDASIRLDTVVPNDLCSFLSSHSKIMRIYFNGEKAHKYFRRFVSPDCQKKLNQYVANALPSTSSSNTHKTATEKAAIWNEMLRIT